MNLFSPLINPPLSPDLKEFPKEAIEVKTTTSITTTTTEATTTTPEASVVSDKGKVTSKTPLLTMF